MQIPKPPVQPLPPHYSPPPLRPPSSMPPLPSPPPGVPAGGAMHGSGYSTSSGKRHKLVYKVGTSSGAHGTPTVETIQEAIAAAQQYLQEHANNAAQNPETPPTSSTVTITTMNVPQPVA